MPHVCSALEAELRSLAGEEEGAGHGTARHGGCGGHRQAERALLQALLSLGQGQLFTEKCTFFSTLHCPTTC